MNHKKVYSFNASLDGVSSANKKGYYVHMFGLFLLK